MGGRFDFVLRRVFCSCTFWSVARRVFPSPFCWTIPRSCYEPHPKLFFTVMECGKMNSETCKLIKDLKDLKLILLI